MEWFIAINQTAELNKEIYQTILVIKGNSSSNHHNGQVCKSYTILTSTKQCTMATMNIKIEIL